MAGIGAGVGATAAVALASGCSSSGNSSTSTGTTGTTTPSYTDNDILNFALNLEYLEAEFYLYAATGSGLSATDALNGPVATVPAQTMVPTTGTGISASYSAFFSAYLNEVAQDEYNHVKALQATITANGGTPVARPQIDLTFFGPLATVAGITTSAGPAYTPFDSIPDFLIGSFIFEDVGVTAYTGAAPLLTSGGILSAAAGIQAVEAYHAAIVRTLIVAADFATSATSTTYQTIANKVATLRATLGGGNETQLSKTSIVAASSSSAIAFSRTPQQVLNIVFGAAGTGVTKGGFFPAGISGNFITT